MNKTKLLIIVTIPVIICITISTKSLIANEKNIYYALNPKNDDVNESTETTSEKNNINNYDDGSGNLEDENKNFSLKGYLKNLSSSLKTDKYSKTFKKKYLNSNLTRLRLSPEFNFYDVLFVYADLDNEIITGNYLKSCEFDKQWRPTNYDDLLKLSKEHHYSDKYLYRTNVHSAYAKLVAGDITLSLGRQQIRFGSGRLWNPLDILNPISPTSIEGAEEQKGTDALKAEYFIGKSSDISIVINQKRKNDKFSQEDIPSESTNILGRFKTNFLKTDFAILGGKVTDRNVYGIDISSIVLDGKLRGGIINVDPRKPENGESFIQSSAGYEYTFESGLYFLLEYFYNQNGLNYNQDLKNTYQSSLLTGINETNYYMLANQILTYNQHYIGLALGYDMTSLIRFEVFSIYDLQGKTIFLNPSVKCNALQNLDISISIMKAYVSDDTDNETDFYLVKKYPMFYASIQLYF